MNNKGFMRTVEAILAVLFMGALYSQLMERAYMSESEFERNPSMTAHQVLDIGEELGLFEKSLNSFDALGLNSRIAQLIPAQLSFNAKIKYFTGAEILSYEDRNNAVIAFDYNFPSYVDTNSVRVVVGNEELETKILWNWYYVPIIIENDNLVKKETFASLKNIELKTSADSNSFVVFVGTEQQKTKVDSYGSDMVDVTFELPYLEPFEKKEARLYYTDGVVLTDYLPAEIINGIPASLNSIKAGASSKTKRATLLVKMPELKAGIKKDAVISYSTGTYEKPAYNEALVKSGSENIVITLDENSPKAGTAPVYSQASEKNIFTVTKEFPGEKMRAQVILDVWYKW